jgi:hypothetical protein
MTKAVEAVLASHRGRSVRVFSLLAIIVLNSVVVESGWLFGQRIRAELHGDGLD